MRLKKRIEILEDFRDWILSTAYIYLSESDHYKFLPREWRDKQQDDLLDLVDKIEANKKAIEFGMKQLEWRIRKLEGELDRATEERKK